MASFVEVEWKASGKMHKDHTHYIFYPASSGDVNAETVILVHGIGSYYAQLEATGKHLSDNGFNVMNFDLIGRGFSTPSRTGQYTEDEHIEQIHDLLEAEELKGKGPFHFIGHSMGGCLITLFAHRHPTHVKTLILLAPAGMLGFWPLVPLRSLTWLHGTIRATLFQRESQIANWRADFMQRPELKEKEDAWVETLSIMYDNSNHAHDALWNSIIQFPMTNIAKEVKEFCANVEGNQRMKGVLIIWGDKDITTPYSALSKWTHLFTKYMKKPREELQKPFLLKTHTIDGGHNMFWQYPDLTYQYILEFLQEQSKL
jgi:pimeloyl-ACP methyl ester carboxylesterase